MDSTIIRDPFIFVADNLIEPDKCQDIINRFEKDKKTQKQGCTAAGVNLNIKNSIDLKVDDNPDEWKDVEDLFHKTLGTLIDLYCTHIVDSGGGLIHFTDGMGFHMTPPYIDNIMDTGYQIQRTKPGKGYVWHQDYSRDRILTFIFYLNTVDEGWTQFWTGDQVSPMVGRGLVFPATWTYFHQGFPPLQTKYIMTGWLHEPH
tara:strand:- start:1219 stop:1824 length:606 start_codon:yes stop_codon:yes gene_type:complete